MVKQITELTEEQKAQLPGWADKWIAVGLDTTPANRPLFAEGAIECYGFAGLEPPKEIVWCSSPIVAVVAGPIAATLLDALPKASGKTSGQMQDGDVRAAISSHIVSAIQKNIEKYPGENLAGRVVEAVMQAIDQPLADAITLAGANAIIDALTKKVKKADINKAVKSMWHLYIGGQFWVGGSWFWGAAWTSFYREVCDLELDGDLWDRAIAYEKTIKSACWWWPHSEFIMVSERPLAIHRELTDPAVERGWNSHRLHHDSGPSIIWQDGFGVWSHHGVRVPKHVIEDPQSMTPAEITKERNAEVRRVMLEKYGFEQYLTGMGAKPVSTAEVPCAMPEFCTHPADVHVAHLYRAELPGDEALVMLSVINSTPEPDGTWKRYFLRVPPDQRDAKTAYAWSFAIRPEDLHVGQQT